MEHPTSKKAVIITALPLESEAIRHYVENKEEVRHPRGTIYTRGNFRGEKTLWNILIAEVGKGNPTAAQETERAIDFHTPDVALFVGISGGIKDVKLGDVVAADRVYYYESGKWDNTEKEIPEFHPRPISYNSGYRLVEQAKSTARENKWQEWLSPEDRDPYPSAVVGPIVSGEAVIASRKSDTYGLIKKSYGDSIGLSMEDFGFLRATYASPGIEALVVRGISDPLDNKAEADSAGWQPRAARRASAFAFRILS